MTPPGGDPPRRPPSGAFSLRLPPPLSPAASDTSHAAAAHRRALQGVATSVRRARPLLEDVARHLQRLGRQPAQTQQCEPAIRDLEEAKRILDAALQELDACIDQDVGAGGANQPP